MIRQSWQNLSILFVALELIMPQPSWSDSPPISDPIYSEPFCLKIFGEVAEKARSSSWQISDRDRHILTQCRSKFPSTVNAQVPLPTADECVFVVKTLVEGGVSKVKEIELPEDQVRSIERCDEVLKYYSMPAANMLPTLKPNEKIVVDRLVYQTQLPQRGDILVINLPNDGGSKSSLPTEPTLTRRMVGLPREKITIKNGVIYINGKLYKEDYLVQPSNLNESITVPINQYLVLDDNRTQAIDRPSWSLVTRTAIVGKVVWHFGSK
jgi:signal peptidase I